MSAINLALLSILIGFAVLTLKYLAYYVTGSIALYSDALESVINVATAIAAFVAIRISSTPADREHPYGHHKAEYLSAVLEGVLIMLAVFSILCATGPRDQRVYLHLIFQHGFLRDPSIRDRWGVSA